MSFTPFLNESSKRPLGPSVRIQPSGNLDINAEAMELLDRKQVGWVSLWFDPETRQIGLKPCEEEYENAYPIRPVSSMGRVSGKAFLACFDITPAKSVRCPVDWSDEHKMLIIQQ